MGVPEVISFTLQQALDAVTVLNHLGGRNFDRLNIARLESDAYARVRNSASRDEVVVGRGGCEESFGLGQARGAGREAGEEESNAV